MADAGFFKGTSAEQDSRFANKQKKLLKQMKFPDNVNVKIDMLKVSLDVIKPWITTRLQELLGIEDDVVIEFVFNQLEDKNPDPKMMQINLTGFLGGSKARLFIGELWSLLASAQGSPDGIPAELVEMKKKELLKRQEEDDRLREIRKREEESHRQDVKPDIHKLDNKPNVWQATSSASYKPRHENGNTAGYKSRTHYDDERRDRDRRRSPPKAHRSRDSRSPAAKSRRPEKKADEDDYHQRHEKRRENPKTTTSRHRSASQSPSHSRSPLKPTRHADKHRDRSLSPSTIVQNSSQQEVEKSENSPSPPSIMSASPPREEVHEMSDGRNGTKPRKSDNEPSISKKKRKSHTPSPPRSKPSAKKESAAKKKASPAKEGKKDPKRSKRNRSASSSTSATSRSSSNSSVSSSSSSNSEAKKREKPKKKSHSTKRKSASRSRSPSLDRHRKSNRKRDEHKSKKQSDHHSKSSARRGTKHHQSNDKKRKSHRDRPDRSTTQKTPRDESPSRKTNARDEKKARYSHQVSAEDETPNLSTPPKKPRLESQIRMQTPPPSSKPTNEHQLQTSAATKPKRTERIVLLEKTRTDDRSSVSTRVSVTTKTLFDDARSKNADNVNMTNSSEDENEIDLRERLLREKAIKSMRRRQLSTPNANNVNTKATTSDQVVYDSP